MKVPATCAAGLVMAVLTLSAGSDDARPQPPRPRQDYNSGEYLYRTFCASCHGESGRGDGPVADLLRRPAADLTAIAARAGGTFPRDTIVAVVDGRTAVASHGPREMPVWGDVLRVVEPDDAATRRRIEALVKYVESMQRSPAGRSFG